MITVKTVSTGNPLRFSVSIREVDGETRHDVTMSTGTYDRLSSGKHPPEQVIKAAFGFLLDHEPKESILGEFDVTVISRYFPDFEKRIGKYF